ncbi:unnamed protein product [Effrenium voratum]|nr:unnamed protein product [Effrenium voratum]
MDDSLLVDVEQVSDSNTDISAVAHASTDSSEESPRVSESQCLAVWRPLPFPEMPGMPRVLLEGCEAAQAAIQEVKAWEPLDLLSGAVHLSYLMLFSSLYAQLPGLHGPQGIDPHTVSRGLGQALVLTAAPGRAELGALLGLGASALAVAAPALRKGAPGLAISATQWVLWRDFMLAGDSAFPVGMTHLAMEGSIGAAAYSLEAYGLASWFWRWCLFRGLLAGGIHKALLCDQSWTDLSAVHWHFQGTPNPSSLGWLAFQLTSSFPWLGHLATASTLTIELAAPFLFFSPRLKYLGFAGNSALQLGILATGNYGPLNFYFLALGLSLLHQTRSELTANESRAVLPAAGLGLAVACYGMLRAPGACPSAYHAIYAQLATVFSSLAGLQGLLSMTSGVEKALGLGLLGLTSSVFTVDTLGYAAPHYELLQQSVLASSAWLQEKWEAFDIAFKKLVVQPAAYLADTLPPRVFDPPPNFFSNTTGVQGRPALALEGAESYFGPWRPVPMKYNDPSKPGLSSAPWPHAAFLDLLWWDAPHLGGSPMWLSRLLRGVMDGLQPVLDLIDRPAFEASFPTPPKYLRIMPKTMTFASGGSEYWQVKPATSSDAAWQHCPDQLLGLPLGSAISRAHVRDMLGPEDEVADVQWPKSALRSASEAMGHANFVRGVALTAGSWNLASRVAAERCSDFLWGSAVDQKKWEKISWFRLSSLFL